LQVCLILLPLYLQCLKCLKCLLGMLGPKWASLQVCLYPLSWLNTTFLEVRHSKGLSQSRYYLSLHCQMCRQICWIWYLHSSKTVAKSRLTPGQLSLPLGLAASVSPLALIQGMLLWNKHMLQICLVDVCGHILTIWNGIIECNIEHTSDIGLQNVFLKTTPPSIRRTCVMGGFVWHGDRSGPDPPSLDNSIWSDPGPPGRLWLPSTFVV
jgi:hypothetical protein